MTKRVKILLVDDQPAKLLSYEAVLKELDEELIRAESAYEALEQLLKHEVAVILIDVIMPGLDGFQLAELIRDHPRFRKTGIIFVSAVQMTDADRVRGYQLGAVDYVQVPVIPELLRAKVRVFAELFRKTQELEKLNEELERRVKERTAELEVSNARLTMAVEVARLGTWDWNFETGESVWSDGHYRLLGLEPGEERTDLEGMLAHVHPGDRDEVKAALRETRKTGTPYHQVYRCLRPDGSTVWCDARARYEFDAEGRPVRMLGVIMDISEHRFAVERQQIMMQELHHRVKNSLTAVQAIASLSRRTATDVDTFFTAFCNRLVSLGRTHTMLVDRQWNRIGLREILKGELDGYDDGSGERIKMTGPSIDLPSQTAISLGLAIHELAMNAVKHGALSSPSGRVAINWTISGAEPDRKLHLHWRESGGPKVHGPGRAGFGTNLLNGLFGEHNSSAIELRYETEGLEFRLTLPWSPHETQIASDAA